MPDPELDFPFDVPVRSTAKADDATTAAAAADGAAAADAAVGDARASAPEATADAPLAEAGPAETGPAETDPAEEVIVEPVSVPIDADDVLLASVELARAALLEDTPADTIGEPVGHIVEGEHVLSLLFECTLSGYPGWNWTVTLSRIDADSAPTVLETELMPGDYALLAPDWVPWSDRLADYRAAQELASAQAATEALDTGDDDGDDDADLDDDTDDDDTDDDDTDVFGDDHGDDALDGIDFGEALAASELNPGEADEAEAEAEDGAPEPPAESGGGEGFGEDDDQNEGEKPRH